MTENEKKMVYNLIHLNKTTLDALHKSIKLSKKEMESVIFGITKSSIAALSSFISFFEIDMNDFEKYIEYVESDLDAKQKKHEKI